MSKNRFLCIEIKEAHFFAYHGLYDEEKRKGNEFLVDLSVYYEPEDNSVINEIGDTVNYERLFELVSSEMETTRDLLETIAMTISGKIKEKFPKVYEVKVTITKINPPIPGMSGRVSVTYQKRY